MSILDRYIARTFISGYIILLLVGIGSYVLADVLVNIDDFTEDPSLSTGQVLANIADFYGYSLPLYFSQLAPFCLAIGGAFTIAMMLRNNELTAIVAAGVPLQRLLAPLVVCGMLLIGVWFANRELVMPPIAAKLARTRSDVQGTRTVGVYCVRDDQRNIITALRLRPRDGVLGHVFIIEPDETGTPAHLIEADLAVYDAPRKTWKLDRGRRVVMAPPDAATEGLGASIRYEPVEEFALGLTPEELVLRQASELSDLLSLQQMNLLLQRGGLANRPSIVMARHVRLTQPVLHMLLLLLAVPAFLSREPANVLACGGRALLAAGVFFGVSFVAQSIIREEHAALMAWLPIFVFGPLTVVYLANVKT